ncbi:LLM class flavin-dependent oxidoreductase [Bacillus sp. FJAT-42376]|uniref:LLM class flavin-dependent oxidoreductase n=1 Tax=Bacillus sp. FJAT-42376 TaxID=2014076 RepID=UPI000F4D5CF1|nr:LLM class flavin-dependent oxidoreductase [Bacillus sp. FJAT-42376]AZB43142.1 LLM class flavin-dependent oxidoreductase [Bacillus sp. FJAT-42376]
MKLSILDQSPLSAGKTPKDALTASLRLAQAGERLGFKRYWIAEHHDFPGLTSSAPEIMLGYIGGQTKTIRLGAGAILLPHYKPYKVAETFNLLSTLFPDRIDLGIGRSPGGSAESSIALSGNFLENVRQLPEIYDDLLHFIRGDFSKDHMFSQIKASPVPPVSPEIYLLGTSRKSARMAAESGTGYVFGQFMGSTDPAIIQEYKKDFKASSRQSEPEVILAAAVICAETSEEAEKIALSNQVWQIMLAKGEGKEGVPPFEEADAYVLTEEEKEQLEKMKARQIIGSPPVVKKKLMKMAAEYDANEVMILSITHRESEKIRSYELIAQEFGQ